MSSVLILGSNGQLGSDLVEVLGQKEQIEVIPFTRREFEVGRDSLSSLPKVDYLINCIAFHNVDLAEERAEENFLINSAFVHQLARWASENRTILIHISTDYIFDGGSRDPYTETSPPNPINIYGVSKMAGELGIKNFTNRYFIFRVSSLFGIGGVEKRKNFVETMLHYGRELGKLKVVDDQWMVPTHTLDVAKGIGYFIENRIDEFGVYNLVNDGYASWYQFAVEIFKEAGMEVEMEPISWREYWRKANRPQYSVLDNRKIGKFLKLPHWREALREYFRRRKLKFGGK
ncbi:MAG: dTDP-4-dehydrorhamnose reductase [Campylobacterales bacterium]